MKKLLLITLIVHINAFPCNFKTGVVKHSNGYLYTAECHRAVGKLVKAEQLRAQQLADMKEALRLKDLQVRVEVERATLWRKATIDMEGHYVRMKKQSEMSRYIWFGLGILATGAAVYGAGKVRK